MRNSLKIIYRILKTLEKSLSHAEFDNATISPEALRIPEEQWAELIAMMVKEGYIEGVKVTRCDELIVILDRPRITLAGLLFLEENSTMRKLAEAAKGVVDVLT